MQYRQTLCICVQKEDKQSSNACVGLCVRELALRVDVHVLEQITEHKCVCVYMSERRRTRLNRGYFWL